MKKNIGIIDYGIGNHNSLKKVLEKIGFNAKISKSQGVLSNSDLILLPGVGAFSPAMQAINEKGLNKFIVDWHFYSKPIIGICLGMQLLAKTSSENGFYNGLGLIKSNVKRLNNEGTHIGWNNIKLNKNHKNFNDFVEIKSDFFFNHSYAIPCMDNSTLFETKFQGCSFSSLIFEKKLIGIQFHPEKSQLIGNRFLKKCIDTLI